MHWRTLVLLSFIFLLSVALFDLIAYQLLPRSFDLRLEGYRQAASESDLIIGGRGSYPKDYFVANASRGFDIGPGRQARHYIQELGFYEIWGNELGCFDRPVTPADLDPGFVYLAGDSFTWGYAPLDQHFGTLLERQIGQRVLKCGVTHTGQAHQLDKLNEILLKFRQTPELVIVNVFANDIANDFAHPHATVIEGWQIDNVGLVPPDQLISLDAAMLQGRIREKLEHYAQDSGSARQWFRRYSISYQLVLRLTGQQKKKKKRSERPNYRSIYDLYPESGEHPFLQPIGEPNRVRLLEWKAHAISHGYALLFALIPPVSEAANTEHFSDLRGFLGDNGMQYADFTEYLRDIGITDAGELYWPSNQHFNIGGNLVYAAFLTEFAERQLAHGKSRND